MIVALADFQLRESDITPFTIYQEVRYESSDLQQFDITRRVITAIKCGKAVYNLFRPVQGTFSPRIMTGEFIVDGFSWISGKGGNPNQAYNNWSRLFHSEFQRLYVMRPFEMTEPEKQRWNCIQQHVNVESYRASQPLVVRQKGKVLRVRPLPNCIEWEDGTREMIRIEWMPDEFAGYHPGQCFEAIVNRNPITHKIICVDYAKRIPSERRMTLADEDKLWNSIPTTDSLPVSEWGPSFSESRTKK